MRRIIMRANMMAHQRENSGGDADVAAIPVPDPYSAIRTNFTSGESRNKPIDYEAIFRCTVIPMGMVNDEGVILGCNKQFLGVSGLSEEELIGKDIRIFLKEVSPEDREIRAENDKRLR
jgi:PAS domain-containing protein